jgi:hypothetical protein
VTSQHDRIKIDIINNGFVLKRNSIIDQCTSYISKDSNATQHLVTTQTGLPTTADLTTTRTELATTVQGFTTTVADLTTGEGSTATTESLTTSGADLTTSGRDMTTSGTDSAAAVKVLAITGADLVTSLGVSETEFVSNPQGTTSTGVEYPNSTSHVLADDTTSASNEIYSTQVTWIFSRVAQSTSGL